MSISVNAVERALDILLCFSPDEPVLSLTRIADQLQLPKSTVHRHLATLEKKYFIKRNGTTGMYRLGLRLVELATLVLQDAGFQQWIQPHLEQLSEQCGETVDLAVMDGTHVTYLQVIESPQRVKIAAAIGQRLPVHCTASGKAFLAFLPQEQVDKILEGKLTRYTKRTMVTPEVLHKDLQLTRSRGFATSEQEFEEDINAIAAPVLDGRGHPVAVIAAVGPAYRLAQGQMEAVGRFILSATQAISREGGLAALSAFISNSVPTG